MWIVGRGTFSGSRVSIQSFAMSGEAMTTQGIRQFFTASTVSNLAEATHKNPLTGAFLKFSESDDVRDMSAVGSLSQGQRGRERLAFVRGRAG